MKAVIRQQVDIEFVMKFYAKEAFDHHEAQEGLAEWTANLEKWPKIDRSPCYWPLFFFPSSISSSVRGQSAFSNRDNERSASNLPPVWQRAQ